MSATPVDGAELRSRVLRGLVWKVASQLVLQGARFAVVVILARLLTPTDYGLAGMVVVLSSLALIFSDLALGAALVQRRTLTQKDKSTVFWTGLGTGVVFAALGVGLAGPVARFYGEPDVEPLFAAFSATFVITALAGTQTALLTREMDFKALELRMMAGAVAGAVAGITIAATGGGAWAILAQQLTAACVSTLMLWRMSTWRPTFEFSLASLRSLAGFSANVFTTRILFYVTRTVDTLLIGRFLGSAAVGAWTISNAVVLFPSNQVAGPIQEVLYPAFSRLQDEPARMADAWIRVNRLVASLSVPALLGMIVVAPDFVHVVLGSRWDVAVPVIQTMAWVGLLQSLQRLNSSILQARDRTRLLLVYAVVVCSAVTGGIAGGLHWGVTGVAIGYAVASTIVEPYYTWLTARSLESSLLAFARGLSGVAQAALLMLACVAAARYGLVHAGIGPLPRLVLLVLVGLAVYVPALLWRAPQVVAELREVRGKRRASAPAAAVAEPTA
ncbi:MAG: lipopolysaccharide biosynthesis protein [Thermoleophilia bacterium]